MQLDFDSKKLFTQSIQIDDIGNVGLHCTGSSGDEFYLSIISLMGKVHILKYGPIVDGMIFLDSDFSLEYKKINYKESAIMKEISGYVNDPKKGIIQIDIIATDDVLKNIPAYDKFIPE